MKRLCCFLILLLSLSISAFGEEQQVYTLYNEAGNIITSIHGECEVGDEYISGDNQHYRIKHVDTENRTAQLENLGKADMPDVEWLTQLDTMPVSAVGQRKIALYCTHSDESYINGDGTE